MGQEFWKGSDGQSDLHGLIWAGGFTAKIPSSLSARLPLSLFLGHLIFWGFSMPRCGFGIITLLTGGTQEAGCGSPGPVKKHTGDGTASLCCVLLVKAMMGPIQIQGDGAPDARSQHRAGGGTCCCTIFGKSRMPQWAGSRSCLSISFPPPQSPSSRGWLEMTMVGI